MGRRLAFLVLLITHLAAAADSEKLRVSITDYADTPPLLLVSAQNRAAQILASGGVRSSWKMCPPSSILPGRPGCSEAGSLSVWVRILPEAKVRPWRLEPNSCGAALTGEPGEQGFLAIIDADCVNRIARFRSEERATVLGHVIAHEIGHLLLGHDSHSGSGLMSGEWTSAEQGMLVRGRLHFNREDAGKLKEAMALRTATYRDGRFATAKK